MNDAAYIMKLRKINVSGISDIIIFDGGTDRQKAIWNHVNDGTHCLASSFELSIKHLLEAHGETNIEIYDQTKK